MADVQQQTISKRKHLTFGTLKFIDTTSIIKLIFWIVFCVVVIAFTIIFINERAKVNNTKIPTGLFAGWTIQNIKDGINNGWITANGCTPPSGSNLPVDAGQNLITAYIALYQNAHYMFIDFSLMTFVSSTFAQPATDPTTAWTTRSNAVDLAYSYMFITSLIALVALGMQVYTNGKMIYENHRIKKYGLSTKFPTSTTHFSLFKTRMYVDFITNLAIVFAFFNFLSTLIVIGYWILTAIFPLIWIRKKTRKARSLQDDGFAQRKSDLLYLVFIMIFQTIYTVVKAVFLSEWGVNLDLIFSIILPIGTITVIVGLFIKNMLSSKVNSVLKSIKSIGGSISTLRTFYYTNGMDALDDFNFVAILPPMIKAPLASGKITKQQADGLMVQLNDTLKFVEEHYANKPKELNFMLYNVMNNITTPEQITEFKENILKLEAAKPSKNK